jgi:hypothetical protein
MFYVIYLKIKAKIGIKMRGFQLMIKIYCLLYI